MTVPFGDAVSGREVIWLAGVMTVPFGDAVGGREVIWLVGVRTVPFGDAVGGRVYRLVMRLAGVSSLRTGVLAAEPPARWSWWLATRCLRQASLSRDSAQ